MIKTYSFQGYRLVLDSSEIYPDDPGNGCPAMVYGPEDSSGTYYAATEYGELSCGPELHELPGWASHWLDSLEEDVHNFIQDNSKA